MDSSPRVSSDSRRHRVVAALREAITAGRLLPGDRLLETEISVRMGISRAPVREALRQLEQEGLVISYPYRGTEVLGVSQEEVEEVLVPIRLTLERFAFLRALPLLTPADFDQLEVFVAEMRRAAESDDPDRLADADVAFHEIVISRSGQRHCEQIWRTIEPRVRAHFRRDAPAHMTPYEVVEEHAELLAVLRTRNESAVLPVLEAHIRNYLIFGDGSEERAPSDEMSVGADTLNRKNLAPADGS